MGGILIRNYTTTAATFNSDDYSDIDGATSGTRKMLLSVMATRFGVQLATDGMVFGAGSAADPKLAIGTAGNGIYASAANTLDVTTNGTRAITVTSGQFIGIGVATPAAALHVGTSLTTSPRGIMSAQYSTGTDGARLHMRKARGTETAPTVIVTGDTLGRLVATGYDGSNYLEMASISLECTGTIAATRVPTRMVFQTATDATPSVLTTRMILGASGQLGISDGVNSAGNLGVYFLNDTDTGIYRPGNNEISFVIAGTETVNVRGPGIQLGAAGTAAAPHIFKNGDTNTGIFWSGSDLLGVSTNGTVKLQFTAGENIGINTTGPDKALEINSATGANLRLTYNDSNGGATNYCDLSTSSSGNLTIAPSGSLVSITGALATSVQSLTGAGAISLTTGITELTSTGVAQALSLADGTPGQEKTIIHGVDGGSMVLTPTTKTGFSTVTFTTAGESVTLVFLATRGWCVKSSYLAVIA